MKRTWQDWLLSSVRKTGTYDTSGIGSVVAVEMNSVDDYVVSKTNAGMEAKKLSDAETDPVFAAEKNKLIALSIVL